MQFTLGALVTLLGTAALVQSMPSSLLSTRQDELQALVVTTETGEIESHVNATALGVDIFGPMPDDHKKDGDHITAEPGSKTWAWIRARIDVDWDNVPGDVKATDDYANLGVGLYTSSGCSGTVDYWDNVQYGWLYWDYTLNMYSVGTTRRALSYRERLDLYRRSGSDMCGTYTEYVQGPNGPGCWNGGPFNCAGLKIVS